LIESFDLPLTPLYDLIDLSPTLLFEHEQPKAGPKGK
jgi:hypothetical protein